MFMIIEMTVYSSRGIIHQIQYLYLFAGPVVHFCPKSWIFFFYDSQKNCNIRLGS